LQSLCLDVKVLSANDEEIEIRDLDDDLDIPNERMDYNEDLTKGGGSRFRADAAVVVDETGEEIGNFENSDDNDAADENMSLNEMEDIDIDIDADLDVLEGLGLDDSDLDELVLDDIDTVDDDL
ncbi:MAG: hypothetical protein RR992_07160, partial [Clostridiales bacterium]